MASASDDQRRSRASSPSQSVSQPNPSSSWIIDLRPPPPPGAAGLDTNLAQHGLGGTPLDFAADALKRFQNGPDIPRPNLAQSFFPVVGPFWDAAADLQDENYGGAFFNGTLGVADAFGVGVAGKGMKAAGKGITAFKMPPMTDNAARKAYRAAGMVGKGEETSHFFGFSGIDRKAPNWRNNYMFLKPLPKPTHRRLTGSWDNLQRFDPLRRFWYGTNDWMKVAPPAVAGRAADVPENLNRQRPTASTATRDKGKR